MIFLGADGQVLEAPTSSVVVARGRILFTPPDDGILAGITVRRLLRAAEATGWKVRTEPLVSADLHAADGVWLASSARLLAPVESIDGRPRSDGGLTPELATLLDMPAHSLNSGQGRGRSDRLPVRHLVDAESADCRSATTRSYSAVSTIASTVCADNDSVSHHTSTDGSPSRTCRRWVASNSLRRVRLAPASGRPRHCTLIGVRPVTRC